MKKNKLIIFGLLLFLIYMPKVSANAISFYAGSSSVYVGNDVYVTVKTSDALGKFTISNSNPSVLAANGTTSGDFQQLGNSSSYRFTAKSPGTVTLTFTPTDMTLYSNLNPYNQKSTITITVKAKPVVVLSTNNNLGSLGIEGKELTPAFSPDVIEYSVEMEPETTKVNVVGSVADGSATVVGLGEREVVDGVNRLEVTVTAQTGTTKTYALNVNVKEYNPIEVEVNGKKYTVIRKKSQLTAPANYVETTVKINEEDIHAFHSDITGYDLIGLKDEMGNSGLYVYKDNTYTLYSEYQFNRVILYPMEAPKNVMPEGYKETTITYNEQKIVAYKFDGASNYALIYGMNVETGKTNLYMYDDLEDTLQIYNGEAVEAMTEKLELFSLIIAGLSGVSVFLLLICIALMISNRERKKNVKNNNDDIQVTQIKKSRKEKKREKQMAKELIQNDKFRL